jgi:hypothetical protein
MPQKTKMLFFSHKRVPRASRTQVMTARTNVYVLVNARNLRSAASVAEYKESGLPLAAWLRKTGRFPDYLFVTGNPSNAKVERFFRTHKEEPVAIIYIDSDEDDEGPAMDDDDETEDCWKAMT